MLSQPFLRTSTEAEEGGPAQEEMLGGVEATPEGGTTGFHQRSYQGAFNQ